jgi:hypothetical protein
MNNPSIQRLLKILLLTLFSIIFFKPTLSFGQPGGGTFYLNIFSPEGKQIFIDSSQKSSPAGYTISSKVVEYSKTDTLNGQIYFTDKSRIGDTLEFISCTGFFQVHKSTSALMIIKNNCDTMRITFRDIPKEVVYYGTDIFVDSICFKKGTFVCDLAKSKTEFVNRKANETDVKRICNSCYYVVFKQKK